MYGLRNIKAAENYIGTIADAAEQQWAEATLFHLILYESKRTDEYVYDCDALYVVKAMQLLWHRPSVLRQIAEGVILENSMPTD